MATYRRFIEQAADLVVAYGGSLSGEHGDGHGRAELWPKMFSPELMRAFTEFKRIRDPDNRINPHKLIDPYPLDSHIHQGTTHRPLQLTTAEAAGARGMHIENPTTCAEHMREAFFWDGPVIIECLVDQHEPPIPAKVKRNQVTAMLQALRAGTPNRNRIALQMVKDMFDESGFRPGPGHTFRAQSPGVAE